jgi:hypothetical protein
LHNRERDHRDEGDLDLCFLVALPHVPDLLTCAKHLFVEAMVALLGGQ